VTATVVVTAASDTFAADLIGPDGAITLFPTQTLTGPATFTGETTITIDTAGNYAVDVTTNSEWTLEFDPA
jgi:hypothetical protein